METNKRIKKSAEEQLSEAQAKVNKLKAEMNKKNRAAETRKKVLVGAGILNYWNKATDLRTKEFLFKLLRNNLNEVDFAYLNLEN
jgi:ABC-type Zn uptake system ZnuABC Zn-binding protein ZnuA